MWSNAIQRMSEAPSFSSWRTVRYTSIDTHRGTGTEPSPHPHTEVPTLMAMPGKRGVGSTDSIGDVELTAKQHNKVRKIPSKPRIIDERYAVRVTTYTGEEVVLDRRMTKFDL